MSLYIRQSNVSTNLQNNYIFLKQTEQNIHKIIIHIAYGLNVHIFAYTFFLLLTLL